MTTKTGFGFKPVENISLAKHSDEKTNLLDSNYGGIYQIVCLKNEKTYIGQSTNSILERVGKHVQNLRHKNHESKELQADWNMFGQKAFKFEIVEYITNENESEIKNRERIHLHKLLSNNVPVYNTDRLNYNADQTSSNQPRKVTVAVIYKGITYETRQDCINVINQERISKGEDPHSRTHASRLMDAGKIPDLILKYDYKMPKKSHKQKPVVVNGIKYKNINLIIEAGLATTEEEIFQKVVDPSISNWSYYKSMNNFYPIVLNNVVYPNVQSAVTLGFSNDHRKITRLLNSDEEPGYYRIIKQDEVQYWFERFQALKEKTNSLKNNNRLTENEIKKRNIEYKISYNGIIYNSFLDFVAYYNGVQRSRGQTMIEPKVLKKKLDQSEIPDAEIVDKILTSQKVPLFIKINNDNV